MALSEAQIIGYVDRLGIKKRKIKGNGWMEIICPFPHHNDKNFGNCSINIRSGAIHCFACGTKGHIMQFVDKSGIKVKDTIPNHTIKVKEEKKKFVPEDFIQNGIYVFTHIGLNPDKFEYTRLRDINHQFCEAFQVQQCLSGYYTDFMITPIIDKKKDIYEFEARKLIETEALREYYESDASIKRLKNQFKRELTDDKVKDSDLGWYLRKRKVLYLTNSRANETIWNIDNLDYNRPLYVVEGLGSVPKIYSYITNNVTCPFGSNVLDPQYEYLRKFKRVIIIPDNDFAGYKMIQGMHEQLLGCFVCDIQTEDTDISYIDDIKNTDPISSTEYLVKYKYTY